MFENIQQAIAFFKQRYNFGIKPGLTRMNHLLAYVNEPHKKIKAIHVTGTNGKGSTIQYIKNALCLNNYKVGQFISPSMDGLLGHIYLNNQRITDSEFIAGLNKLYPAIIALDAQNNHPTEFEIMTVLAFDYFSDQVDFALIETGMGGREDTTNCLEPILSIITNIDKDHTGFLGSTIEDIAYHKAGIIKSGVPVIVGDVNKRAYGVIQEEINRQHTKGIYLGKEFSYDSIHSKQPGQYFIWSDQVKRIEVTIQMNGMHQVKNCSLAIMALVILEQQGVSINWKKSLVGFKKTRVPGRFELISRKPSVILDGAHNVAGVRAFLQTIEAQYQNVPKHLIFAAFKDKDIQPILAELQHTFSEITLTSFDHPRAARASDLADYLNIDVQSVQEDWKKVIANLKLSNDSDVFYFITGSLHFIALVREYFDETT